MAEYLTKSSRQTQIVDSLKNDCRYIGANIGDAIVKAATDFSVVADALAWVAVQLHRDEMDKADKLYKELWGKMSDTTLCKKLWSETELTKWLEENTKTGKIEELCSKLSSGFQCLKELEGYIRKIEPIMVVVNSIYIISSDDRILSMKSIG